MMPKTPKKPVEVVVFKNPEKKSHDSPSGKPTLKRSRFNNEDEKALGSQTFDQKKAKYDIRKLAIGGMKTKEKDKAMVDLLVELGAKRPKNVCLHPREYLEELKRKREEEKEESLKAGIKTKRHRPRKRRNKDDLLSSVDGQKGYYKSGVQFLTNLK